MASILHHPERVSADIRGLYLDRLEERAWAEGRLIRQRPGTDEPTYEESDGRAFRACLVVVTPEGLEARRRAHAKAGQT
jgi:hypothetical protein